MPLDLDAIEARNKSAWDIAHKYGGGGNVSLKKVSQYDVPALIAEVRRLREALTTIVKRDEDNETVERDEQGKPCVWDNWGDMIADNGERHGRRCAALEAWEAANIARQALQDKDNG